MLGFSIPKLLLLFVILIFVWYLFQFLENKSKGKAKKRKNDEETLTECSKCGGFYDKSIKSRCPMCTNAFKR